MGGSADQRDETTDSSTESFFRILFLGTLASVVRTMLVDGDDSSRTRSMLGRSSPVGDSSDSSRVAGCGPRMGIGPDTGVSSEVADCSLAGTGRKAEGRDGGGLDSVRWKNPPTGLITDGGGDTWNTLGGLECWRSKVRSNLEGGMEACLWKGGEPRLPGTGEGLEIRLRAGGLEVEREKDGGGDLEAEKEEGGDLEAEKEGGGEGSRL